MSEFKKLYTGSVVVSRLKSGAKVSDNHGRNFTVVSGDQHRLVLEHGHGGGLIFFNYQLNHISFDSNGSCGVVSTMDNQPVKLLGVEYDSENGYFFTRVLKTQPLLGKTLLDHTNTEWVVCSIVSSHDMMQRMHKAPAKQSVEDILICANNAGKIMTFVRSNKSTCGRVTIPSLKFGIV